MTQRLYNEIKSVSKAKREVICGDFNNPSVNWSTIIDDDEGRRLTEFSEEQFLFQTVQTHTRGNNILDTVFTNDNDLIRLCEVGEAIGNSDHNVVKKKN